MVGRKGAMEVRSLLQCSFSSPEDGRRDDRGMHVERQRQKDVVCVCLCVSVCVRESSMCARFLRAVVVLDLCPFGGRKFACA